MLLAIAAFSLSLLGTFLVRSGVLTSVHAFATDPKRGIFILAFLVIVIGGSLLLYAWRAKQVGLGGKFEVVSRESLLLSNNVLLTVAAGFSAARNSLPVDCRCVWRGEAFGWSTLLQSRVCAAHGAGDVPDGHWTNRALEESESSGSGDATALGFCDQRAQLR